MSLVFKLGYNGSSWVDKAMGKTVYEVPEDYPITAVSGVHGPAAYHTPWSGPSNGGYLYLADSLDFSFGAGDFAFSFWWNSRMSSINNSFVFFDYDETTNPYMILWYDATTVPRCMKFFVANTTSYQATVKFDIGSYYALNRFTDVEFGRSSGDFYLFMGGIKVSLYSEIFVGWSHGFTIPEITGNFRLMNYGPNKGCIEDFSIYKGECPHAAYAGFNPSYPGLLPGFQVL